MTDELISFETAKLAHEKGFNLNTPLKYSIPLYISKEFNNYKVGKLISEVYSGHGVFTKEQLENTISCCTQSLLQRWLREIHGIHITPPLFRKDYGYYVMFPKTDNMVYYDTYEKALEVSLVTGLNNVTT